MKRRTLVRGLGTASVAAAGFSGSAAAAPDVELGIEREVDVSDVEGVTTLEELLDEEDLEALDEDVNPSEVRYQVSPEAESFDVGTACHNYSWLCSICCGGFCPCVVCCCTNCGPVEPE